MLRLIQHYHWNRAWRYVRAMRAVINRHRAGSQSGSAGTVSIRLPALLLVSAQERGERTRWSRR
jgi:hypothetical protein